MNDEPDPLVYRYRLAGYLRGCRAARRQTLRGVATAMDCSDNKIIRIEAGEFSISVSDVRFLLTHYQVTEEHAVQQAVDWARRARRPSWTREFRDDLAPELIRYIGLEAAATRIEVTSTGVPALLQTPDYARAIQANPFTSAGLDRDRALAALRERQRARWATPVPMVFVLCESALWCHGADRQLMLHQLRHLQTLAARPEVSIRVLPLAAGIPAAGTFALLSLGHTTSPPAVRWQAAHGLLVDATPGAREKYRQIFDRIAAHATPAATFPRVADVLMDPRYGPPPLLGDQPQPGSPAQPAALSGGTP